MSVAAIRVTLRDPWIVALTIVTPVAMGLQFFGHRTPVSLLISLVVIAVAVGLTLYATYQRALTHLAELQDREEARAHAAAIAELLGRSS